MYFKDVFIKKLLLILFLFIISCSPNDNIEYREVISTNLYKTNKIQIVRVHFDFNKFNLGREFIEESIIPSLETNKNIVKIYIEGHTDNKGKDWYNYRLGLQRALTVSNIIFTNRNLQNIALKSFGYSNSIADNSTEEGRAINRRADIFIDLVEETFELQTNLIKVDSKNKFNIDLKILLIIILAILFLILMIKFILPIIIVIINVIKAILGINASIIKLLIKISKLKFGKIILKNRIDNHVKGLIGETLTKLKYIIEGYNIIGNGVNDYKPGSQGLDLIVEKDGKFYVREIKYGTSQLGKTKDGKQGSPEYIAARTEDYLNNLNKKSKEYRNIRKRLKPGKYNSGLDKVDRYNPCRIESKKLF